MELRNAQAVRMQRAAARAHAAAQKLYQDAQRAGTDTAKHRDCMNAAVLSQWTTASLAARARALMGIE